MDSQFLRNDNHIFQNELGSVENICNVLFWRNDCVAMGLERFWQKTNYFLVLVNNPGRDFVIYDVTKNTVSHGIY